MTALDFFLSGRELVLRRRFADAVRPLNSALQADPEKTSAHLLLAVCYLNMQPKALSQARTSLTTCIRSHRDLVGLYLMRALVSGEEGNQALEKIAQAHPDEGGGLPAPARSEGGDCTSAEADYRQALNLKPNDDLRYVLLTNRGLMWLQSNRLDDAVADLEAAIRLKPSLYQAHATLAQVYQRQGRLDDAAASFTGRSPAIRNRSWRPGSIAAAPCSMPTAATSPRTSARRHSADLEEAIRQEPDKVLKVRDHVDRAKLFFAGGQSQEALAACDAALALVPDDAAAHRVRISALMELKRYDEVLASADAYIARGKPSAEVFEIRGLAREGRQAIHRGGRRLQPGARAHAGCAAGPAEPAVEPARLGLPVRRRTQAGPARLRGVAAPGCQPERRPGRPRAGSHPPGRVAARGDRRRGRRPARDGRGPATEEERQARVQALFNAARIYALAVEFAAQDVSRQGERAIVLYRNYRSRALDLLDEALKYVADQEDRDAILNDPALRSLRRGTSRAPARASAAWGPVRRECR